MSGRYSARLDNVPTNKEKKVNSDYEKQKGYSLIAFTRSQKHLLASDEEFSSQSYNLLFGSSAMSFSAAFNSGSYSYFADMYFAASCGSICTPT